MKHQHLHCGNIFTVKATVYNKNCACEKTHNTTDTVVHIANILK